MYKFDAAITAGDDVAHPTIGQANYNRLPYHSTSLEYLVETLKVRNLYHALQ